MKCLVFIFVNGCMKSCIFKSTYAEGGKGTSHKVKIVWNCSTAVPSPVSRYDFREVNVWRVYSYIYIIWIYKNMYVYNIDRVYIT